MDITNATDQTAWDAFLARQTFRPFLQSWTMGDVYADIGQAPVRLTATNNGKTTAICFGHVVPARRGKHLSIPYGPVLDSSLTETQRNETLAALLLEVKAAAKKLGCAFVRMSPFLPEHAAPVIAGSIASPLHLLAEHVWYLPLRTTDPWTGSPDASAVTEEQLLAGMRKTARNLIGRAGRDGVTVSASPDPMTDLAHFIRLHEETRRRHGFTPYTNALFTSQLRRFSGRGEATLYLARYQGDVIAASIHMHAFGETSYHHGASSAAHAKIPSSYLLQWTAIRDALNRGDRVYNFWGVAPMNADHEPLTKTHPFNGVTLFKTGFGGSALPLMHCRDLPVSPKYWLTYSFETVRKWKRGF